MHYEEEGDCYYSKNNFHTSNIYQKVISYIKDNIILEDVNDGKKKTTNVDIPITIADYGSADGNSLLEILTETSRVVRKIFSNRDINVVFIDKPDNDFKLLMKNIAYYKQKQSVGTNENNFSQENRVNFYFSTMCGNFYKQCFPHGVVSLALCITSLHWLSRKPCHTKEMFSQFSNNQDARMKYAHQAEVDWEQFLLMRSRELHVGGYLIIFVPGVDSEGRYFGYTDKGKKSLLQLISDMWNNFASMKVITDSEMEQASLPIEERCTEAVCKPFVQPDSKVNKSGLKLLSHDEYILEDPYHKHLFIDDKHKMNTDEYAEKVICYIKAVFFLYLYSALDDDRSVEEKKAIVNKYFDDLKEAIERDIQNYNLDGVFHCLAIRKCQALED